MDSGETDGILVARVRRGDSRAFDQLVRRHLRTAHAVARATLDNPDDADDVCQDAFIRALKRIDDCRNPERFGAWLMAIVRNTAHNRRDYNRIRAAVPLEKAYSAASRDDPLEDAGRAELRSRLKEAMTHLTELQRKVLLLYDLEGWSHGEIASELGISAGSSRVHLHVARKAMRRHLAGTLALGTL
ncbi:MAG: sigma-70 family RNA polymerase sigma factor [Gemmatimonadota bacterium]|nr:sigma-70 family RNA polymerase sigma factor [Gemmatimonadota bacterium]MDE2870395.1 sigma-70 family RNA polymerase sigma factor [Gemmatimonadota bacterium]